MPFLSSIRSRLISRTDTEHEQATLRVVIGIWLFVYLLPDATKHSSEWIYASKAYLTVMAAFMLAAFAILACILIWPQPSPARRVIANVVDVLTVTFFMLYGAEYTAPLYSLYLWITFGCGFRYGAHYFLGSLAMSTVGFAIVLYTGEYWVNNRTLGIGLLIGMVALSLYVLALIKRLYEALDRAETANQAKRGFVSSISHELRTPLNAIIGMNDLLRHTTLNSEQAEMANAVHGASRIMLSLIEDVLDFSKIEAGKITLQSVAFDLHSLIRGTLNIFSHHAASKDLKLGVFVMPDVTPFLKGDERHLQQVLVNLLGNAVKFTERGEVKIIVSVLTETPQSVRLRFAVRDTGVGISSTDQKRIFEAFVQVETPGTRRHPGTGLGTTIAKQLVELMGGAIGMESAPGAGSTFWFDLPFTKFPHAETSTTSKENRVLLVGFPDELRQALTADLLHSDMKSGSAESTAIAAARLSEAAALGQPYRLALVYAESARTDTAGAAVELRDDFGHSPPLILCAPRNTASQWNSCMPAEFASVISLPVDRRVLHSTLQSALAGAKTTQGMVPRVDSHQRRKPATSRNILVADDDLINRKVIAKQLEMSGHNVKLVADGEQALDALSEANYDVVILDSHMPKMNGMKTTRLIRVMEAGRASVPIIMFSADTTPETIQEATAAGANMFLPKPIEAARLLDTIEQLTEYAAQGTPKADQEPAPPQLQLTQVPMLNMNTLRDLEQMGQNPHFVPQLVELFNQESSLLLLNIEETLARHRQEEFKAHIHALKGSALNLGAERLFAHCKKLDMLNHRDLESSASSLSVETRAIVKETQAALSAYVKTRGAA